MKFETYLKDVDRPYLGEKAFFHNQIDIQTWNLSNQVDLVQKLTLKFAMFFSSEQNKNKKPEERIFAQNTDLMTNYGVTLPGIQKALRNMERMGIIRREFRTATGEHLSGSDAHGLTKRRIILDINKTKDLLSTTYDEAAASGYKSRSREKRFIKRRPLSLIRNVINSIIKTQVSDVNARKNKLKSVYLEQQYKQFGDFNVAIEYDIECTDKSLLNNLKTLIFGPSKDILDADWTESN